MTKFTRFKMLLMALVMLVGSGNVWGQTTINFDTSSNWVQDGTTLFTSYGAHAYVESGVTIQGTNVVRNTTSAQDGFAGALGTYSMRIGNTAVSKAAITIASGGVANFSIKVRRWDNSPMPNYTVKYSVDGGSNWTSLTNIGSSLLTTSDFFTYSSGVINSTVSNFKIEIQNTGTTERIMIDDFTWTGYTGGGTPVVSTPTFSPSTGNYYSSQNITISSSTEGAMIYYTTDGSDPDNTDTQYTAPIAVSTTTTIKAIGYKDGMDPSGIALATYTFPAINNVSDINTLRSGLTDGTVYKLTGEALLTLQSTGTGKPKYIQDATGGILIYDSGSKITTSYNIGDGITNIMGTLSTSNGMLQFIPVIDPGAATSTGNTLTPVAIDLANLANYPGQLVKVSGVTINGTGNFAASTNYNLNSSSTTILRTQYSDLNYIGQAIPTVPQDIVGVVLIYNTTAELVPRSLSDFSNTVFTSPTIIVSETTVPAMTTFTGSTDTETITVNGANLTANIGLAVTGTDASLFTLSTNSIAPTDGTVSNVVVTITYTPVSAGSHSATLTLSSTGAESVVKSLSGTATVPPTVPDVIITEVYGGGGNSGATYTNDFFELYNTTDNSVEIGGWSIQYYSAATTGTPAGTILIPTGKYIPAKSHFLIQGASGGAVGSALTTPDLSGTINASGTAGKIILYTTDAAQTISDIASITGNAYFKDYVPYGTTAVPVWGSAMSSNASNTTSAARKVVSGEYLYSQIIGSDFEVATPSPESTGLTTSVNNPNNIPNITAFDGKIRFSATAGQQVEVYNAVGQKLMSATTLDGLNTLNVNAKGVMIVKVGDRLAKVIL